MHNEMATKYNTYVEFIIFCNILLFYQLQWSKKYSENCAALILL